MGLLSVYGGVRVEVCRKVVTISKLKRLTLFSSVEVPGECIEWMFVQNTMYRKSCKKL